MAVPAPADVGGCSETEVAAHRLPRPVRPRGRLSVPASRLRRGPGRLRRAPRRVQRLRGGHARRPRGADGRFRDALLGAVGRRSDQGFRCGAEPAMGRRILPGRPGVQKGGGRRRGAPPRGGPRRDGSSPGRGLPVDAAAHRSRGLGDRRHTPAGQSADHHLIGHRLRSPHQRRDCGHRLPQQLLPRRSRGRAGGPGGRPLPIGAVGVPDRRRPAPHQSAVGRHDGARRRRRRGRDRPAAEGSMALQPRARTGAAAAVRRQPGIGRFVRDPRPHGRQRAARHRQDDDAARHPRRQHRRARTAPRLLAAPRARLHGDHAPVVVRRRILAHDPPTAPGAHRIRDGRRLGQQRRRREHQR